MTYPSAILFEYMSNSIGSIHIILLQLHRFILCNFLWSIANPAEFWRKHVVAIDKSNELVRLNIDKCDLFDWKNVYLASVNHYYK